MKVHIALVGGQPIPEYIGIKNDLDIDVVIFLHSNQTLLEAQRLASKIPIKNIEYIECSPVNLKEIESVASGLLKRIGSCDVTLNLTSGTKLWALTFYRVFSAHCSARFIYVDQNNQITDILTKETFTENIDPLLRFELYGTSLSNYKSINEYTNDDLKVMKDVQIARYKNIRDFSELTVGRKCDAVTIKSGMFHTKSNNGSCITFDGNNNVIDMTLFGGKDNKPYEFHFESDNVFDVVFNSGWFELKTANEFRGTKQIKDIWLNCEFRDSQGQPKNEIDVILVLERKLFFVECKTMVYDATDIDKFHSAFKNFGGTSGKGIFVTNERPNERTKDVYRHAMEKCQDNDILTFNFALWKDNPTHMKHLDSIINTELTTQSKR